LSNITINPLKGSWRRLFLAASIHQFMSITLRVVEYHYKSVKGIVEASLSGCFNSPIYVHYSQVLFQVEVTLYRNLVIPIISNGDSRCMLDFVQVFHSFNGQDFIMPIANAFFAFFWG